MAEPPTVAELEAWLDLPYPTRPVALPARLVGMSVPGETITDPPPAPAPARVPPPVHRRDDFPIWPTVAMFTGFTCAAVGGAWAVWWVMGELATIARGAAGWWPLIVAAAVAVTAALLIAALGAVTTRTGCRGLHCEGCDG